MSCDKNIIKKSFFYWIFFANILVTCQPTLSIKMNYFEEEIIEETIITRKRVSKVTWVVANFLDSSHRKQSPTLFRIHFSCCLLDVKILCKSTNWCGTRSNAQQAIFLSSTKVIFRRFTCKQSVFLSLIRGTLSQCLFLVIFIESY